MDTRAQVDRFLQSPSLAEATRRAYRGDLAEFAGWLERRGTGVDGVDVRALTEYAAELGRGRPKRSTATVARKLAAVRSFLRFTLGAANVPDVALAPRRARRLPDAPKPEEVEQLLAALEEEGPRGLRDRALVELVYSAGLRSAEAVGLDLADVDFEQEHVHVRGKGGKERVVPLGEEASYWAGAVPPRRSARSRARRLRRVLPLGARPPARHLDAPPHAPPPAPPPPRVRHPPARGRRRPAHDPGAARPQLALDDAGLLPRRRPPTEEGL